MSRPTLTPRVRPVHFGIPNDSRTLCVRRTNELTRVSMSSEEVTCKRCLGKLGLVTRRWQGPTLTPRVVRGLRIVLCEAQDILLERLMRSADKDALTGAVGYIHALLREWDEAKAKLSREGTKLPEGD